MSRCGGGCGDCLTGLRRRLTFVSFAVHFVLLSRVNRCVTREKGVDWEDFMSDVDAAHVSCNEAMADAMRGPCGGWVLVVCAKITCNRASAGVHVRTGSFVLFLIHPKCVYTPRLETRIKECHN